LHARRSASGAGDAGEGGAQASAATAFRVHREQCSQRVHGVRYSTRAPRGMRGYEGVHVADGARRGTEPAAERGERAAIFVVAETMESGDESVIAGDLAESGGGCCGHSGFSCVPLRPRRATRPLATARIARALVAIPSAAVSNTRTAEDQTVPRHSETAASMSMLPAASGR